jgi:hypothetical protein
MTLALSNADVAQLRATFTILLAPYTHVDLGQWRSESRHAVERLLGADQSGFLLPVPGEPYIDCDADLLSAAIAWERYYHRLDVGLTVTRRERGLEVFTLGDIYDLSELPRTELYTDWQRPNRLHDAMAMAVDLRADQGSASVHCYYDRPGSADVERGRARGGARLP